MPAPQNSTNFAEQSQETGRDFDSVTSKVYGSGGNRGACNQ